MNEDPIIVDNDKFFEGIIVGGGTCGLAIASRLCESTPGSLYTDNEHQRFHWLKQRSFKSNKLGCKSCYHSSSFKSSDLLIIDQTSNKFIGQWDNQFNACQIPFLRSPMFFHLDPLDIDGMISYAHNSNRQSELMEIQNVVGKEISKHKLKQKRGNKKPSGLIDINQRDWKDYYRPSTPLFHDYCESIVDRYNLRNSIIKDEVIDIKYKLLQYDENNIGKGFLIKTKFGQIFGCKFLVVASGHKGKINYPIKPFKETKNTCHTTHLFTNQVKFLDDQFFKNPKSKKIVIVGGGLTSAQLAHVACNDPTVSQVTLLFRSKIKIKHFDFHLDWVSKFKNFKKSIFYNLDSNELKYKMINNAREGGSINPEYYKKLKIHLKQSGDKFKWFTETSIVESEWVDNHWNLKLSNDIELKNIDYIYFATGITADINSLNFLNSINKQYPIEIEQGFPVLTDNLQWNNEIPLFLIGKNASLTIGPTSANLDGARIGAERIGWYLQNMKLQGKFNWSIETTEEVQNNNDVFNTQLNLAGGNLNWYELLECNA
ncbi:uncharacterized protein KGF55_004052 [Candida pseudojiufengensis]|uniref:uncharacterized protein n=1 Tax=Candida pseudojiufengensis TaxID=497109 RepID=UPI00222556BC|nr:uncharacterized protein KGF55_004052 [Candida pseudojiufengensis]KAI5961429.1 hypothetical protein KGF55_004052 [Candida pseudojiufengensis]